MDLKKRYSECQNRGKTMTRRRSEFDDAFDALAGVWDEESTELPPFEELSRARAALADSRIPAMMERVEAFEDAGEPLVVFSSHRGPIDALQGREGWAVIHGDIKASDRAEAVEAFQRGDLKGIALTIRAGGTGLTLTRASNVLFVDRDWNPGANIQAEDRVVRIGQTANSVTIMIMKSSHPLARRIEEIIEQKTAMIEAAIETRVSVSPEKPVTEEELLARIHTLSEEIKRQDQQQASEFIERRYEGTMGRVGGNGRPQGVDWPLELVRESIQYLRSGCDGARERDASGFSRADVPFGWALAMLPVWTPEQEQVARALCVIYKRQLSHIAPPK